MRERAAVQWPIPLELCGQHSGAVRRCHFPPIVKGGGQELVNAVVQGLVTMISPRGETPRARLQQIVEYNPLLPECILPPLVDQQFAGPWWNAFPVAQIPNTGTRRGLWIVDC